MRLLKSASFPLGLVSEGRRPALPSLPACSVPQKANSTVSPLLQVQHPENKLEPSPFTSANGVSQDLSLNDQVIDILTSEDPGSMLQALEE